MPDDKNSARTPARVLTGLEAVRKRPGMYFGEMGVAAVKHVVSELVSNSIDEFLANRATEVRVKIVDNVIEVADDGAGLPFDVIGADGEESLATYRLLQMHFTRSADEHAPHIHTHGASGLGLAPVNYVSTSFKCQSWRNAKLWQQEFSNGCPLYPARIISEGEGRGTTITLTPNADILEADRPCLAAIRAELFQVAHLFPGLKVGFQDETFHAPCGLADLAYIELRETAMEEACWENKPVFHLQTRHEDITIHAAALGGAETERDCAWHTWVNGSLTVLHGTHRDGFMDALTQVQWKPVIAMLHVVMHDPRYAGPTRDCMIVKAVREKVCQGILPALTEYCHQHLK
jgi:DNA gyrase subunit B